MSVSRRLDDGGGDGASGRPPAGRFTAARLVVVVGILICANVLGHVLGPAAHVAVGAGLVAALLVAARAFGMACGDVGLARSAVRSGAAWGAGAALVVAVGYACALAVPAVRSAVGGSAAGSWDEEVTRIFVAILFGTAVPEELAFRGVLLGLLRDRYRPVGAAIAASLVFALWHVLPALGGGTANEALDHSLGAGVGAVLVRVGATLGATFAAGMIFCALRLRSRSLLAPVLAHWAVNGFGVLFVRLA